MDREFSEICIKAVDTYGTDAQTWMAVEEMSELSNAIAKYRRNRVTNKDVCEEIADVFIMLIQLSYIYGVEDVDTFVDQKMDKLKKKLSKHDTNNEANVEGEV